MFLFLTTFGIVLAAQDMRSREVSVLVVGAFLLSLIPYAQVSLEAIIVGGTLCMIIVGPFLKKWLAAIDAFFLILTPFLISFEYLPLFLIMAGILVTVYHMFFKNEKAPFLALYVPLLLFMLLMEGR